MAAHYGKRQKPNEGGGSKEMGLQGRRQSMQPRKWGEEIFGGYPKGSAAKKGTGKKRVKIASFHAVSVMSARKQGKTMSLG